MSAGDLLDALDDDGAYVFAHGQSLSATNSSFPLARLEFFLKFAERRAVTRKQHLLRPNSTATCGA